MVGGDWGTNGRFFRRSGDAVQLLPCACSQLKRRVRTVFVIGPDKKIKLQLIYPMSAGRNFDEVMRVLDSLQLTAKHQVSTLVNWKPGDDVIISGSVSNDEAAKKYPRRVEGAEAVHADRPPAEVACAAR